MLDHISIRVPFGGIATWMFGIRSMSSGTFWGCDVVAVEEEALEVDEFVDIYNCVYILATLNSG